MNAVLDVVAGLLLALGCFTALTSALGLYRLPDFFARIHAAGKTDTLVQLLVVGALLIEAARLGHLSAALKLVLISIFLLVTSPTATHAIASAAYQEGLRPWSPDPAPSEAEESGA